MADHKILNKVIALLVFILAFTIFFTTMAPTVSFWDCGEYIASCYSLGIPHPPGNPFFILLGRVFTMILQSDQVAFRVNFISVLTGAFSALFLYLIVVRSVIGALGELDQPWKKATAYIGGIVGATFGVFNYTFWFSAIEASVYVPSILTIIINVYLAIVWAQSKDKNRDRFLLLFSYLSFLGVGLHMFALFSLIPIFAYVLMVDKEKRMDWRIWGVAFIMGSVAYDVSSFIVVAPVLFILLGIMAYVPRTVAGLLTLVTALVVYLFRLNEFITAFDEFTVEIFREELFHLLMLSLPYLVIMAIAVGDLIVPKEETERRYSWKFCFYFVLFALIGYSVHLYIPIRSALEPMIDENHPVIRLDNDGKSAEAKKLFEEALANESQVFEFSQEYIAAVEEDEKLSKLYSDFNKDIRQNTLGRGKNPAEAMAVFDAAVAADSLLTEKFNTFIVELNNTEATLATYSAFTTAVKSGESFNAIQSKYDAFKKSLKGALSVRNTYVDFVKEARVSADTKEKYLTFVNSFKVVSPLKSFEAYEKAVLANKEVKPLYEKYLAAIEGSERLKVKYSRFKESLERDAVTLQNDFLALQAAVDNERGAVEEAYFTMLDAVNRDANAQKLLISYEDDVNLSFVGKDNYNAFINYLKSSKTLQPKYDAFLASLDTNAAIKERYNSFVKSLGHFRWTSFKMDAFKGFLERKQYGSESMIVRALHRRGALTRQFGFDGHMGLLGFHLTQFYHFGESINTDRMGSAADDKQFIEENRRIEENNKKLSKDEQEALLEIPSDKNNILGNPFFIRVFYVLIYLIPTFLVIFGIGYWAVKLDLNVTILFSLLVLSTTIGFAVYMNFADGTRPDSKRDIKQHEKNYKKRYKNYEENLKYWEEQTQKIAAYYKSINQPLPKNLPPRPNVPKKTKPGNVQREVRIRDYFYTAGFTFFGLWIGLSAVALMHMLFTSSDKKKSGILGKAVAGFFLISPIIPILSNYKEHDRTDDWIPYDYAYNLLMSCKPNAILFTNGDNDTFPLWFLQEAEGIRKDVRVVNFSLLNTPWYIRQLRDLEPKVPIPYTDYQIEPSDERDNTDYGSYADFMSRRKQKNKLEVMNPNPFGYFEDAPKRVTLDKAGIILEYPTFRDQHYLSIANVLVHDIINHNNWEKPIYFTVNTPYVNLMGTDPYLEIQGMVQELKKEPLGFQSKLNLKMTQSLLDSVYQFRVLEDDMHVTMTETATKTARNYGYVFLRYVDAYSGYGIVKSLMDRITNDSTNIPLFEEEIGKINDEVNKLKTSSHPQASKMIEERQSYLMRITNELQMMKYRIKSDRSRLPGELVKFRKTLPHVLPYIDRATKISPEIDRGLGYRRQFLKIAGPGYDKNGYPIEGYKEKVEKKVETLKEPSTEIVDSTVATVDSSATSQADSTVTTVDSTVTGVDTTK